MPPWCCTRGITSAASKQQSTSVSTSKKKLIDVDTDVEIHLRTKHIPALAGSRPYTSKRSREPQPWFSATFGYMFGVTGRVWWVLVWSMALWHNMVMLTLLERLCKILGALVLLVGAGFGYLWFADPFSMKAEYETLVGSVATVAGDTAAHVRGAVHAPDTQVSLPGIDRMLHTVRGDEGETLFSRLSE